MKAVLITLLAGILAVGCAGSHVDFPRAPDQPIDRSAGHPISAEASGFQLLLWIPIGVNERHEKAWQQLRRQAPNQFITDIKVQDSWTYALIGTIYTVRMEAIAYPYVSP